MSMCQRYPNGGPYTTVKLSNERGKLIAAISKEYNWPVKKSVLVNKYLERFIHFTNSIDYKNMKTVIMC
jgi:hypothetical protein